MEMKKLVYTKILSKSVQKSNMSFDCAFHFFRPPQAFSCFRFLFTMRTVCLNFEKFVPVLRDDNQVVWLIGKVFEVNKHSFELEKMVCSSQVIVTYVACRSTFQLLKDCSIIVSNRKNVSNSKETFQWNTVTCRNRKLNTECSCSRQS